MAALHAGSIATGVGALLSLVLGTLRRHGRLLEVAGVAAILLLSFWVGMGHHWDYKYPLHADEWAGLGFAQSTLDAGRLQYPNPYRDKEVNYNPEMGFHLLLGFLKATTDLSWLGLYRIAPGIVLALLAFLVYAFGRRDGFGWAAALFVLLIPTSIRTLGPAFLVPVSAAMLFIPVTLIVVHRMEAGGRGQSLWLLLVLVGGTLFVHPPTEAVVTALAASYLAALVVGAIALRHYGTAMNLVVAVGIRMLIPAVVLGMWLPADTALTVERSVSGDPLSISSLLGSNTGFFGAFGVLGVALFLGGAFAFVWDRRYGLLTYVLPAITGVLLWFLLFVYPRYQVGPSIVYERGWLYLGLFMAVFAGYGVAYYFRSVPALTRGAAAVVPRLSSGWMRVLLLGAGIGVVTAAIATSLLGEERSEYASYYRMIDDRTYADFTWIGQHTVPGHNVVVMEPSLARSYPPVAGSGSRVWRTILAPRSQRWATQVHEILVSGDVETSWLRARGVSVLYTCFPGSEGCTAVNNSDLLEVRRGVYLAPPQEVGER